ncbi:MAG: hypothetical protein V2A56_02465 [bacterium]
MTGKRISIFAFLNVFNDPFFIGSKRILLYYAGCSRIDPNGILGQTRIISVSGSKRASVENLEGVLKALSHGLAKLRRILPIVHNL